MRYIVALDCGHRVFKETSVPPTTASVALCPVCRKYVGVIVHAKERS